MKTRMKTSGTKTTKTKTRKYLCVCLWFSIISNKKTSFIVCFSLSLSLLTTCFPLLYHFKSGNRSSFFGDGTDCAVVVDEGMPKVSKEIGGGAFGFSCCVCGIAGI